MSRASTLEQTFKISWDNGRKSKLVNVKGHERAERIAKSYPDVVSVAKVDPIKVYGVLANRITDELMEDIANPKMSPLAFDEFLWMRRKNRRKNRIINKKKLDSD